ncbi:MAG: class I SAM-dependent methyltransferase [Chitinophagaceae bacterium]
MNADLITVLGSTDIYLIDQIMKSRYIQGDVLLDAGCGTGRNLHWFLQNNFEIYAIDTDPAVIQYLTQENKNLPPGRFRINAVEHISFDRDFFDGIISSAVLHFAKNKTHFFEMMDEMYRVLKPGGTLFIRMASDIGIEDRVQPLEDHNFLLPDGSTRFLLTRSLLEQLWSRYSFAYLDDFKTVNVNDIRCMSTLMLQKEK